MLIALAEGSEGAHVFPGEWAGQAILSTGVHLCESPNLPAERFDSSLEISTWDGQVHDVVPN